MNKKSLTIALTSDEELLKNYYRFGKDFDFSSYHIDFVHVVRQNLTASELTLLQLPDPESFEQMKPVLTKFLMTEAQKILPKLSEYSVSYHVYLDLSPAESVVAHLTNHKTDLVVVATKPKKGWQGFFGSSFADKMLKFSPCDVLVLREKNT